MLRSIGALLLRLPGTLWRNTVGRMFARPPAVRTAPVELASEEPRSVAGITFRASLVVVAVVLASYLLFQLRLLLILVFLAIVVAAGLYGLVRLFERAMPRILSVLLAYLLLIAGVALVLFLIFPPLVAEAIELADDIPRIAEQLRDGAVEFVDEVAGEGVGEDTIGSITAGWQDLLPEMGSLLSVPLTIAGILTNTLVVVFLSALMLIERDRARGWLMEFVDEADRDAVGSVIRNALLRLGAYVRGQLVVMLVIGLGSALGMVVLGVPFAVPLGTLSFATASIPIVGAFIAGGPIVLVALTVGVPTAVFMALWLIVLQQLEGNVITPLIQGRVANLSAIAVLLGVLAGTSIAGIVGGIIAIPLVAVADVVLRDIVFPLRRRAEEQRLRHRETTETVAGP